MSLTDTISIERRLKVLEREIRLLKQKEQKEDWCSAGFILKSTGWNKRDLERARNQGLIKFRTNKNGGYDYLLQSLNPVFIKNN